MLLKGILDQSLYTNSSPTFLNLILSGLTASMPVSTNASKQLETLSVAGFRTLLGLGTGDSPTFTGLTIGSLSGILKAASGVVAAATIGTSLSYSAPTLNTIQGIRTADSPTFAGLTLTGALLVTHANYPVIRGTRSTVLTNEIRAGVSVEHATSGNMADGFGGGFSFDIKDSAGTSNPIGGVFGVRAGADNTGDLWFQTYLAGTSYYRMVLKSSGLLNLPVANALGLIDSNASHYLRLGCGSDLTADRILTLTTGDAARTLTLSGNPTLADWFDQSVKQAASPTFAGATIGSLAGVILGTAGVLSALEYVPWTTPGFSAGDYTAGGSMTWTVEAGDVVVCAYNIMGKKMTVSLYVAASTIGGTPNINLRRVIPASKTATKTMRAPAGVYDNSVWGPGFFQTSAGGTYIDIYTITAGNFTVGTSTCYLYGQIEFEIN
jgi:hypothetical protein